MQTSNIPLSPLNLNAAPAARPSASTNTSASPNAEPSQFSQALSRQMGQRQAAQAPAPAPRPAAPARQQAGPARTPDAAPASAPAPRQENAAASEATPAEPLAKESADATDAAAAAVTDPATATTPVADMLALVASFNQAPVAVTVQAPTTEAPAATRGLGALPGAAAAMATQAGRAALVVDANAVADASAAATFTLPAAPKAVAIDDVAQRGAAETASVAPTLVAQVLPGVARGKPEGVLSAPIPAMPDSAALPTTTGPLVLDALAPTGPEVKMADTPVLASAPLAAETAQIAPREIATQASPLAALATEVVPAATVRARDAVIEAAGAGAGPAAPAPLVVALPQAALAVAQAASGVVPDKLAARVGTPAWDNQIGQKIVWMVAGKEQSATLTLNPPDLGPMQVVLSVTNDQASVSFTAAQPEVRQALENAMPRLREMMSDNGIALGNASVNAGASDQRQAQDGQTRQSGDGQGNGGRGGSERVETNGSAAHAAAQVAARPGAASNGMVDTFA